MELGFQFSIKKAEIIKQASATCFKLKVNVLLLPWCDQQPFYDNAWWAKEWESGWKKRRIKSIFEKGRAREKISA